MALNSAIKIIGDGIVAALNADPDLAARAFVLRKKPYNRNREMVAHGVVCPLVGQEPPFENQQDSKNYRFSVTVCDSSDAALADGMAAHLGAVERIEHIFRNKSHGFLPSSLRTVAQGNLNTAALANQLPEIRIQQTTVTPANPFVDSAFEVGYDASSVIVTVLCLVARRDSASL